MSEQTPRDKRSQLAVITMIALIIGGSLSWVAWDHLGASGIDPKAVKEIAQSYERECAKRSGDTRSCKRHIGRRHRECLHKHGIVRRPSEPVAYDEAAYGACMRASYEEDMPSASAKSNK